MGMNATPRIPQATLREEWAVAVTQLWARALGGAVAQAHTAVVADLPACYR
ncbi:hypothetical protein GCM10028801_40630 [Nocardioides maradonensis]